MASDGAGGAIPRLVGSQTFSETALNSYASQFRDILLTGAFGTSADRLRLGLDDYEGLLKDMSLLGTRIIGTLFDTQKGRGDMFQIGRLLRGQLLPDTSTIQVALADNAQDFVFPWQILTLKSYTLPDDPVDPMNLWGYRYVIEVKRCGDGADRRDEAARGRRPTRLAYGRWKPFRNQAEHHQALTELAARFEADIVGVADDRDAFVTMLGGGGGELIYVYAHGHAAVPASPMGTDWRNKFGLRLANLKQDIAAKRFAAGSNAEDMCAILDMWMKATAGGQGSALQLTDSRVPLQMLADIGSDGVGEPIRLGDAPIVVLNTCESAQLWCAVGGSFVGFFLDRGARAVVGTEATIPIVVAEPFGRTLLASLLSGRRNVGEAVRDARLALLAERNPLGLSYAVYGAANARLVEPQPPPPGDVP